MGQIDLQVYLGQIDRLLEENRLAEAAAHCRQILERHPRHVDTYRLLGRALLEQKHYADAIEIFSRLLSAIPDDLVAHAGIAEALKDRGDRAEAIYHLERALELDPYNQAIREELTMLYDEADNFAQRSAGFTRAALARTYFRGSLYHEAANELRGLLAQNPDRMDLQTLLAETLWKDGRRLEAAKVALDILAKLPNCIRANAVLADIWITTEYRSEAVKCLERLRDLTLLDASHIEPNTLLGSAFSHNGGVELPKRVMIEELEYLPIGALAGGDGPDWVQEFITAPVARPGEPDWNRDSNDSFADFAPTDIQQPDDDDDVLDWLREVAVSEASNVDGKERLLNTNWTEPDASGEDPRPTYQEEDFENPAIASGSAIETDIPQDEGAVEESELVAEAATVAAGSDWLDDLTDESMGADKDAVEQNVQSPPEDSPPDRPDKFETLEAAGENSPEQKSDWLDELAARTDEVEQTPDWLYEKVGLTVDPDLGGLEEAADWLDVPAGDQGWDSEGMPPWLLAAAGLATDSVNSEEDVTRPSAPDELGSFESEIEKPEVTGASLAAEPEMTANDKNLVDEDELSEWLIGGHEGMEVEAMGISDEQENGQQESPEGMDDAMKWLEELAAEQQGSSEDAAPAADEMVGADQPESDSDISEEAGELAMPVPESEAEETASDSSLGDELEEPGQAAVTLLAAAASIAETGEDDGAVVETSEEATDDDLSWLDQIAAGEGAAIDEPPTMSWEEQGNSLGELEVEPVDELSWLAQLETVDDEKSPAGDVSEADAAGGSEADFSQQSEASVQAESGLEDFPEEMMPDVPEDPDDAMAWLEQLAAMQGVPDEELPSMSDLEMEGDESAAPVELDAAIPADEVGFEPIEEPGEHLETIEADTELEMTLAATSDVKMPSDEEEAITWLNEITSAAFVKTASVPAQEDSVVDEMPTPAAAQDVVEARAEAEALIAQEEADVSSELLDEVPEDPDDAMAWLEQLAARQGASPDELVSIDAPVDSSEELEGTVSDLVDQPEFEATERLDVLENVEPTIEPDIGIADGSREDAATDMSEAGLDSLSMDLGESGLPASADVFAESEPEQPESVEAADHLQIEDEALDIGGDLARQDVGDSLPEWLDIEPETEIAEEELGWLDALAEPETDSWLEAEESATKSEIQVPDIDFGYEPEPAQAFEIDPTVGIEPKDEVGEIAEAGPQFMEVAGALDDQQLSRARTAADAGDIDQAIADYRQLLEQGEGLPYLIADLESAVEAHGGVPGLRRLLGDAYARNGQLQKALEAYRQALDHL